MNTDDQRVPLSDLGRKLGQYVRGVKTGPVTVTDRGEPVAVLVDFADYRSLIEMEEQAEDLYWTVVALRRSIEWQQSPGALVSREEVERRVYDDD